MGIRGLRKLLLQRLVQRKDISRPLRIDLVEEAVKGPLTFHLDAANVVMALVLPSRQNRMLPNHSRTHQVIVHLIQALQSIAAGSTDKRVRLIWYFDGRSAAAKAEEVARRQQHSLDSVAVNADIVGGAVAAEDQEGSQHSLLVPILTFAVGVDRFRLP